MPKSYDKLAHRLALILTKLNSGERFTAKELVDEFGVNLRTIQRDLNERFASLPIKKEGDYYRMEAYALGKLSFEDIKNFAALSGIRGLFPSLGDSFITEMLNNRLNPVYLIKGQGFEDLGNKAKEFEMLSSAIVNNRKVSLHYKDKIRTLNPYKLVSGI